MPNPYMLLGPDAEYLAAGPFEGGGGGAEAVAAHEAADSHPTYETSAEATAKVDAHAAAANPHPGYLTQAEADALYAAIGAGFTDPMTTAGDLIYESGGDLIRGMLPILTNATTPAKLTDGDDATETRLPPNNSGYATFDLGSALMVAGFRLKQTTAIPNGGSGPYRVQSGDASTGPWTDQGSGVAGTADSGSVNFAAPVAARYWKFVFYSGGGAWSDAGWHVYVMSLFGAVAPARLPAGTSNQILTVNPVTGIPGWATPAVSPLPFVYLATIAR